MDISKEAKLENTNRRTVVKENKIKVTASTLMRWAGLSAVVAGLCFIVLGMFHPVNIPAAVTTATWVNVHMAHGQGIQPIFDHVPGYKSNNKRAREYGLNLSDHYSITG